jgi:conjugal transfer ATP-binding protein TraC
MAVVEAMVGENEQSKLTKLDRTLLEKSILDLYSHKRKTADVPTLTDLSKYLADQDEPSLKTMAKLLYVWTGERPYGQLLDGQGTLRTDASICTFDLKGLSNHPDLQSVMILILTDFILSQVEHDRTSRKRIILDEAWELLKSQSAANFMEYCARTLRKTGSGITFITQAVADIESSPIGTAILNNTATKLVMLQRGATDALSRTLKLNSQELALIHSLTQKKGEYSEGFLIEGDERQVIRVSPSPLEYWLSTSDAEDNAYLERERKKGLTLTEAIEKAAHEIPTGIAAHREVGA